ncbi:hypothetical protein, partial [Pseudomonas sp. MWU13-2517]|uniref:hypothetical protein n=1 Tax=Pseudomonas sp. MWU13-2517 TaxID=2929055 RepID=UPI00200FFDCE
KRQAGYGIDERLHRVVKPIVFRHSRIWHLHLGSLLNAQVCAHLTKRHAVGEINAKCFCIFGMVQHIFTRIDLYPQDAASTFFNEML